MKIEELVIGGKYRFAGEVCELIKFNLYRGVVFLKMETDNWMDLDGLASFSLEGFLEEAELITKFSKFKCESSTIDKNNRFEDLPTIDHSKNKNFVDGCCDLILNYK